MAHNIPGQLSYLDSCRTWTVVAPGQLSYLDSCRTWTVVTWTVVAWTVVAWTDVGASISRVKEISWLDLYLSENVDDAVALLTEKLTYILDEVAPMRTIQVRTRYAPWLSKRTIQLMK